MSASKTLLVELLTEELPPKALAKLGAAFADYDASGRMSLMVANDKVPGDLLHNLGGRFEDVLGVGASGQHERCEQ